MASATATSTATTSGRRAHQINEDQFDELREAFMLFDGDGDGSVDKKQLHSIMLSLGQIPSERELNQMIQTAVPADATQYTFDEFLTMIEKKLQTENTDEEIKEAFRIFDKDNSGSISSQELRNVLNNLGENLNEEEIEELVKEADVDGDGQINYEEFLKLLNVN
ncbi:hypothetical protein Pelo_9908 [Pelomyxa schiedti]|nr:hypothetical protein Pelo_9908 [Pelomyxa schiedti]